MEAKKNPWDPGKYLINDYALKRISSKAWWKKANLEDVELMNQGGDYLLKFGNGRDNNLDFALKFAQDRKVLAFLKRIKKLRMMVLEYINQPIPQNENMKIVERSVPVPFFGNIERARVATISINPSNLEFEDKQGNLLPRPHKRFYDRDFWNEKDTDIISENHTEGVYESLYDYFRLNPYKLWFDRLEKNVKDLLGGSYYNGTMVHLDIYPWATKKKWSKLPIAERKKALDNYDLLKKILRNRNFECIYINSKETKEQLEKYFDKKIEETPVNFSGQTWKIYEGELDNGTKLIGLSCNIQSSRIKKDVLEHLLAILKDKR